MANAILPTIDELIRYGPKIAEPVDRRQFIGALGLLGAAAGAIVLTRYLTERADEAQIARTATIDRVAKYYNMLSVIDRYKEIYATDFLVHHGPETVNKANLHHYLRGSVLEKGLISAGALPSNYNPMSPRIAEILYEGFQKLIKDSPKTALLLLAACGKNPVGPSRPPDDGGSGGGGGSTTYTIIGNINRLTYNTNGNGNNGFLPVTGPAKLIDLDGKIAATGQVTNGELIINNVKTPVSEIRRLRITGNGNDMPEHLTTEQDIVLSKTNAPNVYSITPLVLVGRVNGMIPDIYHQVNHNREYNYGPNNYAAKGLKKASAPLTYVFDAAKLHPSIPKADRIKATLENVIKVLNRPLTGFDKYTTDDEDNAREADGIMIYRYGQQTSAGTFSASPRINGHDVLGGVASVPNVIDVRADVEETASTLWYLDIVRGIISIGNNGGPSAPTPEDFALLAAKDVEMHGTKEVTVGEGPLEVKIESFFPRML